MLSDLAIFSYYLHANMMLFCYIFELEEMKTYQAK